MAQALPNSVQVARCYFPAIQKAWIETELTAKDVRIEGTHVEITSNKIQCSQYNLNLKRNKQICF